MSPGGLYYYDMSKAGDTDHVLAKEGEEVENENKKHPEEQDEEDKPYVGHVGPISIKAVTNMKSQYSNRGVDRANHTRRFQEILGASLRTILQIVDRKLVPNCPITRIYNIKMADHNIYGPSRAHLKGKTVHRSTDHVVDNITTLPATIMAKCMSVTLCADFIFINAVRFFTTMSRHIQFVSGLHIADVTTETLEASLKSVRNIYLKCSLKITNLNMDSQFKPVRDKAHGMGMTLNTVSADEHVPEIERCNIVIKERVRSAKATLPFIKLTVWFLIELVATCIFWHNILSAHTGISTTMSPRSIITGMELDYYKYCKIQTGEYVQTHLKGNNTMNLRTIGAVALRPTGNSQGGYFYISLKTGKQLNRGFCTPLPTPAQVIDHVHAIAKKAPDDLIFGDRNNNPLPATIPFVDIGP